MISLYFDEYFLFFTSLNFAFHLLQQHPIARALAVDLVATYYSYASNTYTHSMFNSVVAFSFFFGVVFASVPYYNDDNNLFAI